MGRGKGVAQIAAVRSDEKNSEDPQAFWHDLYQKDPSQFLSLPQPLTLPTEWPILAFLYACAHNQEKNLHFTDDQYAAFNDGLRWLKTLVGSPVPDVSFWSWDENSLAEKSYTDDDGLAFSCCAEPQMRGTIIFREHLIKELDRRDLAAVVIHEIHHGVIAEAADAKPQAYLEELASAIDEMAVGFTEQVILQAMKNDNDGQIIVRKEWAKLADENGSPATRWLVPVLDLTTGEPPEMCRQLTELAIEVLCHPEEKQVVSCLNRLSSVQRDAASWKRLLAS